MGFIGKDAKGKYSEVQGTSFAGVVPTVQIAKSRLHTLEISPEEKRAWIGLKN